MIKIGYYPGCSLEGTSSDYGMSVLKMAEGLGWQLQEIEDWNCCGATAAHQTNHLLALSLPARVLALAEEQGFTEILAPCAACTSRLIGTNKTLTESPETLKEINGIIEMNYKGTVKVLNVIQALRKYAMPEMAQRIRRKLTGLKVACYYGCLLVRQPKVLEFDDAEDPKSMEEIVAALGAEPVDWPLKTDCCGAGLSMSVTPAVVDLTHKILANAKFHGAQVVAVACPMCHSNLDMRQLDVNRRYGKQNLPIMFLTQLVGLALGISEKDLGLKKHFTKATSVVK
jgi:heterodisulfide reductase subunit B